ncbi:MAG: NAD(P)-dependent alcohol dehydrogenase [Bdellovibrionaceae bacterium]|nr:NAD(P)-dependent alcohol dehydrogenase [Pseudobdellovibrionaceae bacterium]
MKVKAYAAHSPKSLLEPYEFERRALKADDVAIQIHFCGICHSDIHTARGEWGTPQYPCVPGHEIVGHVTAIGKKVKKFKVGEAVGVGCMVDSCGKCVNCKNDEEQFCTQGAVFSYNSTEYDGKSYTKGGYATGIVVRDKFVLKIKKGLPLDRIAPLLCAGITTYSPLKRFGTKKGSKVGVVGLGGLGHMAIKIAKAMGAEVTVFSTSLGKEKDAKKLGGKNFVMTKNAKNFAAFTGKLDLIIDTVSVAHDYTPYLSTLKVGGTQVLIGVPEKPTDFGAGPLIFGRKQLAGSLIGGIKETQEMLDFCAKKKIFSDIELIKAHQINDAYDRTVKGDVKYRFVIDAKTF